MNSPAVDRGSVWQGAVASRSYSFRRCAFWIACFAVAALVFVASRMTDMWSGYREQRALLDRVQQQQIEAAAGRIALFVREIEIQLGWLTQLPADAISLDDWRFESVRVLRQVPAITELTRIDAAGREQVWVSRLEADVVGGLTDFSRDPKFVQAMASKRYYSPVYFRRESEPYMSLAVAGASDEHGVVFAEVNLKFIWSVISEISVGLQATAFVVDSRGRLIAHPDLSLALRNTDLSQACKGSPSWSDIPHQQPLYVPVPSLGWTLMVCGQGTANTTRWG